MVQLPAFILRLSRLNALAVDHIIKHLHVKANTCSKFVLFVGQLWNTEQCNRGTWGYVVAVWANTGEDAFTVARIKCWQLTFCKSLICSDVHVSLAASHIDAFPIRITSNSHYMLNVTRLSYLEVEATVAARPVTAVQHSYAWRRLIILSRPWGVFPPCLKGQNRYFKPKHDLFLTLTKMILCL